MRFVFRADASLTIGTEHVMRCLTLADTLACNGHEVIFLSRDLPGDLNDTIRERGYQHHALAFEPEGELADLALYDELFLELCHGDPVKYPIDWLVVDHYGLDDYWESQMRPYVQGIFVIDDLADRTHDCDLLLDQNYMLDQHRTYQKRVPEHCLLLVGSDYALIRPEFTTRRETLIRQNNPTRFRKVRHVLVNMGDQDVDNLTETILEGLNIVQKQFKPRPRLDITVVIGQNNQHRQAIQRQVETLGFEYYVNPGPFVEKMIEADLFIGGAGISTWERMAIGLPGIIVTPDKLQMDMNRSLAQQGYQFFLGPARNTKKDISSTITPEEIASMVHTAILSPELMVFMREKGLRLIDAQGTARVCDALESLILSKLGSLDNLFSDSII